MGKKICYILSARFQLENQSAPARLGSARNLHSSAWLELENSSSGSSLIVYPGSYIIFSASDIMEAVRGQFRVWYEGCVIQVILLRNKCVGVGIGIGIDELIPLRGEGHIPPPLPVLANHSLKEKAKGLYFSRTLISTISFFTVPFYNMTSTPIMSTTPVTINEGQ